jgi:D-alanyl-D-alanine carboxypeptidase
MTHLRTRPLVKLLIAFIILSFLSEGIAIVHGPGTDKAKIARALQPKLDSLISKYYVPGATFTMLYGNWRKISLASGLSDIEQNLPMNPDAMMFSGSVGKTLVAAMVLKLHEKGRINMKARATEYLGNLSWFKAIPNAKDITVEMLLNHTAGIPEYVNHMEIWQEISRNPDKIWSPEERLSYICGEAPANPPGKGWNYADSHYIVLGAILEKVTGKTYYSLLREMILKPCDLDNTRPADQRDLPGLIPGYTSLSETLFIPGRVAEKEKYAFNPQLEWTGGGVVTNGSDLVSWAKQLYGGDFLTPGSLKMMVTPVPFSTSLPENAGYGLGCIIGETGGVKFYGHSGFVPGYLTIVEYVPSFDLALAMQVNSDALHGEGFQAMFNEMKIAACQLIEQKNEDRFASPVN